MGRKLISFDWAMKKLLRSKANFSILEGFLSELLFTDITIDEILESESNQENDTSKFNRVDIKVRDGEGRILLIELQHSRQYDYLQRILYGTSKVISEQMRSGDPYANISKVILISIVYFDFVGGTDYIYQGTTNFIGMHNHENLHLSEQQKLLFKVDSVQDLYPIYYLIEVNKFNGLAKDPLDQWIHFLKTEELPEKCTARGLESAKEILDIMKMTETERVSYEKHQQDLHQEASMYLSTFVSGRLEGLEEGLAEGEQIGIAKGEQIGILKGKIETARMMKSLGMSDSQIEMITGLSPDQWQ